MSISTGPAYHAPSEALLADVDDEVGPESPADLQALGTGAGENHPLGPERFAELDREQADGARALDEHGLAGEVAPHEIDRPERGGRGGHHAGLLEREVIGKLVERVDVIHRVLGKTPVARQPLGAMALGEVAVVKTRGVPALDAVLAA